MDPLTHTLTGLMISRTGLGRLHKRAPLALLLAANAPDIDGLTILGGAESYVHYHRGLPHSIVLLPLIAMLPVLFVCAMTRSFQGWWKLYIGCVVGVASHLLIDWTNSYGVRFLLPFSSEWLHLDLNTLVDLWILAVLLIGWLMIYIVRMVNSEIGAKPGSGRGLAIFALLFFVVYDYGKFLLHQRAVAVLDSRIYDGTPPSRVAAFPTGSNPFSWRGWVETKDAFKEYPINLMSEFDPGSGTTFYKPDAADALAAARSTRAFQVFLGFNQYPRWSFTPIPEPEGGKRVELQDLRFSVFRAIAILDRSNRVQRAWMEFSLEAQSAGEGK
jgi:inner membrane protein